MKLEEKFTLDEFIIFAKGKIKNIVQNPSSNFIDKVTEIYERKKNTEFNNPLSKEFTPSSNKIEYWLERGWEQNAAEQKRQEKVEASSCSLLALTKKHGKIKGKELFDEINNRKSNTLEGFIQRHGKTKGTKLYNSYKKQMSEQNTLDGMIKRYGKAEGEKKYENMISRKAQTLENHIKRYGQEEGIKRYSNSNKKRKIAQSFEGFVDKYGVDAQTKWDDHIREICERTSINHYIKKFGSLKYHEWFNSTIGGNKSYSKSQISITLFEELENSKKANFGNDEIMIELTEDEKYILSKQFIRPDFQLNNKIIEFYGTYWHCHSSMFEENQLNYQTGKTAKEVWDFDSKKIDVLVDKGFDVLVVWEHEYSENREDIIEKCNKFLKS